MSERAPAGQTSIHVRRATRGDADSVAWLYERLSPLLLEQARYRLRGRAAAECDPEDLVQDVWAAALPRLVDLQAREGRETPVLLRFLGTTLVHHVNNLARKRIRRKAVRAEADLGPASDAPGLDDAPDPGATGVATGLARRDAQRRVLDAIDALETAQRDVLVLRGVEQLDNKVVADLLGLTPNAVSLRYARALEKLRARLPGGVFDELD